MSAGPESFGPYLVHEQLGAGGMAEVHRAEQAGILLAATTVYFVLPLLT